MDENQFLECMNSDFPQLQLTRNDLAHPTASTLRKYYSTMLEQVTRMNPKELCGFTFEQQEFLRNGGVDSSMEALISSYNLYMAVKYVINNIELFRSEIHYSDILFPYLTPKRSLVFMTTMYLFFVSCAEFDCCYEQMDTVAEKQQQMTAMQEESCKLKQQLRSNEESKVQYADRVKDIKSELASYAASSEDNQVILKDLQQLLDAEAANYHQLVELESKAQANFAKVDNEKKYLESLIVSDESSILDNHGKYQAKKGECLIQLQELENKRRDGLNKESQFEKVLGLQETLINTLKEPVVVDNSSLDLKGLNTALEELKKQKLSLESEEKLLTLQVVGKEVTLPCRKKEVMVVETENDSIMCTWKEKQSRYSTLVETLQRSVTEANQRLQMEEPSLMETRAKILTAEAEVAEKEEEVKAEAARQVSSINDFKEKITERLLTLKQKTQAFKKPTQ